MEDNIQPEQQPQPAADRMARARAAKKAVLSEPPQPTSAPPPPEETVVMCHGVLQPPPGPRVIISSYDIPSTSMRR